MPHKPLVVIVDDDAFVCQSLIRLLVSSGIGADAFTSAVEFAQAIERISDFRPDCVIVDMHLTQLTGYELLTRLHRMRPDTPVIFLTEPIVTLQPELPLPSGAVASLAKPIDADALMATLTCILKRRGSTP